MIDWIDVRITPPPFGKPILVHMGYEKESRTIGFHVVAIMRASPVDGYNGDEDEIEAYEAGAAPFHAFQFYLLPAGKFWHGFQWDDNMVGHCLIIYSDAISHWAPLPNQPPGFTKITYR